MKQFNVVKPEEIEVAKAEVGGYYIITLEGVVPVDSGSVYFEKDARAYVITATGKLPAYETRATE